MEQDKSHQFQFAHLNLEQLREVKKLEHQLGVALIAYEQDEEENTTS